jgi:hypothetical protein
VKIRGFEYSHEVVNSLEATLSKDRLTKYLDLAHGDMRRAIKIYVHNTMVSESLYGPLQGLEVAVRNSFHVNLSAGFGPDWYDKMPLEHAQREQVAGVKYDLALDGKPVVPGRVVAGLSFGFWTGILGRKYEDQWRRHLRAAFPRAKTLMRKDAHSALSRIRILRNRIAHHEPILHMELPDHYKTAIQVIEWICPNTAKWVQFHSRFEEAYETRLLKRLRTRLTGS